MKVHAILQAAFSTAAPAAAAWKPNIVVLYADHMGLGRFSVSMTFAAEAGRLQF